jgi:hypothetical protein
LLFPLGKAFALCIFFPAKAKEKTDISPPNNGIYLRMTARFALVCTLALGAALPISHIRAQAGRNCPLQPTTLKAMRECYRPSLVFAPSATDPSFVKQQKLLDEYADDMMDRNLLYVPLLVKSAHLEPPLDAPYVLLKQQENQAIRQRFHIAPSEFAVLLIGKDGGEKFRSSKPLSVLRLDEIVDAMPMRQQEKEADR